jgi:hypothetical protein
MPFSLDMAAITADGAADHLQLLVGRLVTDEALDNIDETEQDRLQPSEKTDSEPDYRQHDDELW